MFARVKIFSPTLPALASETLVAIHALQVQRAVAWPTPAKQDNSYPHVAQYVKAATTM